MLGALALVPRRLLVVMAHPDDAEFFAGGYLARVIAAGCDVQLALLTDGQGGSMDPTATRASIGSLRRREQEAAAAILGVRQVHFCGGEDGRLFDSWPLRLEIARLIRRFRPDVLLTTDPALLYDPHRINHPDHRAAGAAALAAAMPIANVRLAANELSELEPHTVSTFLLAAPALPNTHAVLDEQHLRAKVRALEAHASQFSSFDVESFMRARARSHGRDARAAGIDADLAEPFTLVTPPG